MTFYLLGNFENYYNRQIKKFDTIEEYLQVSTLLHTCQSSNFNPRDGVQTHHTFNIQLDTTPDYCVACNDKTGEIVSRWFVMESEYTAAGQYLVHLYRDVVAEEFEKIINAPCFIEKATLKSGPFLYNKENMSYNQIKKSEVLLKDATKTSWIVGYLNKGVVPENPIIDTYTTTPDITVNNISTWEYYRYINNGFICYPNSRNWKFYIDTPEGAANHIIYSVYSGQPTLNSYETVRYAATRYAVMEGTTPEYMHRDLALQSLYNKAVAWDSQVGSLTSDFHSQSDTEDFLSINNKTIKDDNSGKLYRITLNKLQNTTTSQGTLLLSSSLMVDNFLPWVDNSEYFQRTTRTPTNSGVNWEFTGDKYKISLTELKAEININWTESHNVCPDEIFDMFCIPADGLFVYTSAQDGFFVNKEIPFKAYSAIDKALTSGQLLDIQLLPYCPVLGDYPDPSSYTDSTTGNRAMAINISSKTENKDYNIITGENNTKIGIIFWAQSAKFDRSYTNRHLDLDTSSYVNYIDYDLSTPQNIKVTNECDIYRLCSPNYNGQFDLNIAKNGGFLGFNIHCAYKPYTPYIQIEPIFGGLYGESFKDARGLICGGDFSLPQKDSKWAEYQLQNKNYQVMFDRQIQNMTDMNEIALKEARWQVATGTFTGAAAGAAAGSMIGKPFVGAIGGAVGGAVSLGAGIADIEILKKRQALTMDYTKDMFGYNLENIQALPYSITKVGAFVNTNKIFPFIEYYTCTDEEKQALIDKMKWNGMTVGVIGKIADYIINEPTYIKGRIIRLESLAEDYHYATVIGEEITKGVYI